MAVGKAKGRKASIEIEDGVSGMAALAICESMLLSLADHKIIDDREARAILRDAEAAHRNAALLPGQAQKHTAAADLVKRIKEGKNSIRAF